MDINKIVGNISMKQSYIIDEEIRNLCKSYGFEPENIRDTPYRLVIELNKENTRQDIYLTEIKDVRRLEINTEIIIENT